MSLLQQLLNWLCQTLGWFCSPPKNAINVILEINQMTQTATLTWDFPTERESGFPIDPNDIDRSEVFMSADQGENFAEVASIPQSGVREVVIPDLDPGTWVFRISIVDASGRASEPFDISDTVIDDSPPGAAQNVTLTLE